LKDFEAFLRHFQRAFDYKCEAFIKFKRLFQHIFKEVEAFVRITRLLKYFVRKVEAFLN
jgi:hypothetical protein